MSDYKEFSPEIWDLIKSKIDLALSTVPEPWYAAFDADGTLWSHDAGNKFFDYEIDNKLVPLPDDPWGHVYSIKTKDPEKAFLWLAQINKGKTLEQVRSWAKTCFEADLPHYPYLNSIKNLVEYLQFKGVEVCVVTASVKWSVEPAAASLGISPENVLGVKTKIENGIITDKQDGPITYQAGKGTAFLEHTSGIAPILAAGNTTGDIGLIDLASHLKIAVRSAREGGKVFASEVALQEYAQKHGWIFHSFV